MFRRAQMAEEQQMAGLVVAQCGVPERAAAGSEGFAWDDSAVDPQRMYAVVPSPNPFLAASSAVVGGWQYAAAPGSSDEPSAAAVQLPHQAAGRAESGSEGSDLQGDPELDDGEQDQASGGGGKRQQCKNLEAERKRRKKLNDRLYKLRSLVPNITKVRDRVCLLLHRARTTMISCFFDHR
jgi:hypothetical protein